MNALQINPNRPPEHREHMYALLISYQCIYVICACNIAFDAKFPIFAKKAPFMQRLKTENSRMFVHTSEGKLTSCGPLTPQSTMWALIQ